MAGRARKRNTSPDYIKYMLVAGGILIAVVFGYQAYKHYGLARFFYDDVTLGERYPVRGIDVSNHNGRIDYDKVAAAGYSFVFVKSSEGATFKDPRFKRNCKDAAENGLKVGAYHFFRKNREGEAQAVNFMQSIKGVKLDMPLVVDVEDWENVNNVDDATVQKRLRAMVKTLKASGYKVMIYTNGDGMKSYYEPNFKGEYLWLCTFNDPDSVVHRGHTIQQFSHWGKVNGVKGEVDLNVFMGTSREWEQWLEEVE